MRKKYTCRDFLKAASIGTASVIALSCGLIDPVLLSKTEEPVPLPVAVPRSDSDLRTAEILILGTGIARLVDDGVSVIVLEARDRIGGRFG